MSYPKNKIINDPIYGFINIPFDLIWLEIASRSRGTPRIANQYVKRVRDFAQVKGCLIIKITS